MILISPGIYYEEVIVNVPSLTIRGVDRNKTIVDGEFERANGFLVAGVDGVAIENITARNALLNGFYWATVEGYRGSYLTAYNNGDYGVYAFDAVDGVIEHSYASGSPDAGFYIGQCYPCDAVINNVISENNGLGYSGTNSGGDLYIINSIFRDNKGGIAPNTLDSELLPPERESYIIGNLIENNNNLEAPAWDAQYISLGNGVVIAGGNNNYIKNNVIVEDLTLPIWIGSWSLALIGLFNVFGTLMFGKLGDSQSKKNLLAILYSLRSLLFLVFIFLPKNEITILIFAALLGILWLSTVPLTSGIISVIFGSRYMSMLYGFSFLSHQIGSFLGSWFGGRLYDYYGSYDIMWWMCVALGFISAAVHMPIIEKPLSQQYS